MEKSFKHKALKCTILESNSVPLVLLNESYQIVETNDLFTEMVGKIKEDIIGKTLSTLVDDLDVIKVKKHLNRVLKTSEIDSIETKIKKSNIEFIWSEIRTCLVYDTEDRPNLLCRFSDISKKKEISEALKQKRFEYIKSAKIITDGLDILGMQTSSLDFNGIVERVLPLLGSMFYANACVACDMYPERGEIAPTHQWGLTKKGFESFMALTTEHDKRKLLPQAYSGQFVLLSDTEDPEKTKGIPQPLLDFFSITESKSFAIIPISYDGQVVFMIGISFKREKTLSSMEEKVLHIFKQCMEFNYKASLELNDAILEKAEYEHQYEIMKVFMSLGEIALTSSRKEQVAHGAVKNFGKFINTDIVEFLEFDKREGCVRVSGRKYGKHLDFTSEEIFSEVDMKTIFRMKMNQTVYISDLSKDPLCGVYEKRFLERECRSLLVTPIYSRDELRGMIALGSKNIAAYSKYNIDIVNKIVSQISVAFSEIGLIERLKEMMLGVVDSFTSALDAKSHWTEGHSRRVTEYSTKLGDAIGLGEEDLYTLKLSALFHDIGKIGTYDSILNKAEKLTDEEWNLIREHPGKTSEILSPISELNEIGQIALYHHERWDGGGYPSNLMGEQIPYLSRIICITDSFDAMTAGRPYSKALSLKDALQEIKVNMGKQFDPDLSEVFIDMMEDKKINKAA